MGIVKWMDEWWFSGIQFQHPFEPDIILDKKNSIESRMSVNFLDYQSKEVDEMLTNQLKAFKDFNNGQQIVFLSSEGINEFIRDYTDFFNESLNLSEKEISEAKERIRKDGFFGMGKKIENITENTEEGLVYFNPKSGCEIVFDVNSAFPLPNNPYFKKENSETHIMRLLMDESISKELVMYCIEKCKTKLPFFKIGVGKQLLNDIDFLLRFWKKENYHTNPSITMIGEKDK